MRPGRLNYIYRLSAARLVILRMRIARRWKSLFHGQHSSSRSSAVRGLVAAGLLIGMSGAAWLGYQAGQQTEGDPIARVDRAPAASGSPAQPVDAAELTDLTVSVEPATSKSLVDGQAVQHSVPGKAITDLATDSISPPQLPTAPVQPAQQTSAEGANEIVDLRETVGALRAKVQALEQETTGLEFELLDKEVAFAQAEEQWNKDTVERRVVYNITNIPVGGAVSEEFMGKDVQWEDIPASVNENDSQWVEFPPSDDDYGDQINGSDPYDEYRESDGTTQVWNGDVYLEDMMEQHGGGMAAEEYDDGYEWVDDDYSIPEPGLASELPIEQQIHQEVLYGPAPDQQGNWDSQ